MSYKSPITLMMTSKIEQIATETAKKFDDVVFKALHEVVPLVDEAELLRALQYDRGQYDKGFEDGKEAALNNRWIPVTERLPKEQGYYLVAHQRSGCVAERFYYRDCPDLFVKVTGDPVTHWMPLPEPPKEEV